MRNNKIKNNFERFLEKSKKIHGASIDNSKVRYIDSKTKVCLICHKKDKNGIEHGEYWQTPAEVLRGHSCPKCANGRRGRKRMTTKQMIKKCQKRHGDLYTYEKTEYIDSKTKICVTCRKHGDFYTFPYHHINGEGCPKCHGRNLSAEEIVEKFKEVHGVKYDYSSFVFTKMKDKSCFICKTHGEFWQTPQKHLEGHGCPKCAIQHRTQKSILPIDTFVEKANLIHNNQYDYSLVFFKNLHNNIDIICKKHGVFSQIANDHLNGHGCPICGLQVSRAEDEIVENIENFRITCERRVRNLIPPFELDIYIPEKNVAIEYNGLVWHSDKYKKDKNYHLNKTLMCEKLGIMLIHIFEDEWLEHKEIVKAKIRNIIGCKNDSVVIQGENCIVNKISQTQAKVFLNKSQLSDILKSSIYLGAFNNKELIGIMSFRRNNKNEKLWRITNCATDISKHCVGIEKKLFEFFVENFVPTKVSFLFDRRWHSPLKMDFCDKSAFNLEEILKPQYQYVFKNERINKEKVNMSEKDLLSKIYDCGKLKYVWTSS